MAHPFPKGRDSSAQFQGRPNGSIVISSEKPSCFGKRRKKKKRKAKEAIAVTSDARFISDIPFTRVTYLPTYLYT